MKYAVLPFLMNVAILVLIAAALFVTRDSLVVLGVLLLQPLPLVVPAPKEDKQHQDYSTTEIGFHSN